MDDDISIKDKGHGKKQNQKLKPYLVTQYLMDGGMIPMTPRKNHHPLLNR